MASSVGIILKYANSLRTSTIDLNLHSRIHVRIIIVLGQTFRCFISKSLSPSGKPHCGFLTTQRIQPLILISVAFALILFGHYI